MWEYKIYWNFSQCSGFFSQSQTATLCWLQTHCASVSGWCVNSVRLPGFHKDQRGVLASRGKRSETKRHCFPVLQREFRSSNITGGAPTSCTLQQVAMALQDTRRCLMNDWLCSIHKKTGGFLFYSKRSSFIPHEHLELSPVL